MGNWQLECENCGLAVEGSNETVDHARDFSQFGNETCAGLGGNVGKGDGTKNLGSGFAGRTLGVAKELFELGLSRALGPFGDVVRNAVGCAGNLILETPVATAGQQAINLDAQSGGSPPDLQLFKRFIRRFHVVLNFN